MQEYLKKHPNTVYWCNLKVAQKEGLQFCRTRSHAIALFNILPATCIEKVVYMKTGEDLCKVHQSPRLPRVVLTPNLQCGCRDPPNPEARKPTVHQSEQSVQCSETCRSLLEDTRRELPGESQRCLYREKPVAVTLVIEFQCTSLERPERRLESQGNRQKTDSTVRETPELGLVNRGFEQD